MKQKRVEQLLSVNLETAKQGITRLHKQTHSFPAVYILFLEESGKYYIGSTGNLYIRIGLHVSALKKNVHGNSQVQRLFNESTNKTIRVSFIRVDNREDGFTLEQKLLDQFMGSGLLMNKFTDAKVNGLGGSWSPEAKEKQREVGKRNVETGKMNNAWEARRQPVTINGVLYESMAEASRRLGKDPETLRRRINKGQKV